MLFVEPRFFVFFILVLASFWAVRSNLYRKYILLIASYTFYAAWDYRFLSLILLSTVVDYISALKIENANSTRTRKHWLLLSMCVNLGMLFFFKYFNFFAQSFQDMATQLGVDVSYNTLNIVLPVGISFYTFQTMSYTIDVYRNNLKARKSLLDVAVFVAFFPQLVAGPIVRAIEFLPQLDSVRRFVDVPVKACLILFLIGYIKKAGISDNIAPYIDEVFANPGLYTASSIYAAVLLYATQIYCDFSGYSDMAIAVAGLLGYRLPLNFAAPYFAYNISDFWRRWHISLSTWLRDYLYIPLGGNRHGELMTYRNLMLTMLLGGLWHGASWNFVIWGGLHGLALSVNRQFQKLNWTIKLPGTVISIVTGLITFYWVCLAWIFFRAKDLSDSISMSRIWLLGESSGQKELIYSDWVYLVPFAIILHWIFNKYDVLSWAEEKLPWSPFWVAYGAAFALAIAFIPVGYRPFIYFQF